MQRVAMMRMSLLKYSSFVCERGQWLTQSQSERVRPDDSRGM